jgi:hypothetical protein
MSTVELSRDGGEYTAVHVETGISGTGETEVMALAVLAEQLADRSDGLSAEFAEKVSAAARSTSAATTPRSTRCATGGRPERSEGRRTSERPQAASTGAPPTA